jgi:hypothetical protein
MMATSHRCPLCGKAGAACGTPTVMTVQPVDAVVTGVRVAGDKIVPDLTAIQPTDMTDEEREEFRIMSQAYERRRLRNTIGAQGMADGKAPHTQLSYVLGADGITRKMHPDVARQYVDMNEGSEITREGALPVAKEGEVIGATKATIGEMFDENGRQREDVQPLTSRTFLATDRTRNEAVSPAVGTTGAASTDVNTGTGSQTSSSATSTESKPTMRRGAAHPDTSAGTGTNEAGSAGAGDKKDAE